ncbi:hypothetical protein Hanom_Chr05g00396641 [Helianthus anomalus]
MIITIGIKCCWPVIGMALLNLMSSMRCIVLCYFPAFRDMFWSGDTYDWVERT